MFLFIVFIVHSTRPSLKRIEADFFSDADIAAANLERQQRAHLMNSDLVGQKSASEIRATLRHQQKVLTEF